MEETTCFVSGTVRDEKGEGAAGLRVRVLEHRPTEESQLAEGLTGADGGYRVTYTPPANAPFWIVVKVEGAGGAVLHTSEPMAGAPDLQVDFLAGGGVYPGDSEYQVNRGKVVAILGERPIAGLIDEQGASRIGEVARASGLTEDDVVLLFLSDRMAAGTAVPAAVFYGFLALGKPAGRPDPLLGAGTSPGQIAVLVARLRSPIVLLAGDDQKAVIDEALRLNKIPYRFRIEGDAALAALAELLKTLPLMLPGTKVRLQDVLDVTGLPPDKHGDFARRFARHDGPTDALWSDLAPPAYSEAEAADLRLVFALGPFVVYHPPVLAVLRTGDGSTGPRGLAALDLAHWKAIITSAGTSASPGYPPVFQDGSVSDRIDAFARQILDRVEAAFPTPFLAARLAAHATPILISELSQARVLSFLAAHPDLELVRANLTAGPEAEHVAALPTEAQLALKRMQRALRLAPRAGIAFDLLLHDLYESGKIHALGEKLAQTRLRDAGLGVAEAQAVYQRAEQLYAMLLTRIAEINQAAQGGAAAEGGGAAGLMASFPTLRTLFGAQDFCSCEHCNSVFGPAAYFVDVLRFLSERVAQPAKKKKSAEGAPESAKGVLFRRRPDLGTILLDCQNTNTPVPYVDLVCELLEDAVAPPPESEPPRRQSRLSPAELRVRPEHLNAEAYDVLRDATFPSRLPFHLWLEHARLHLDQLGVQRWRLLDAFRPAQGSAASPTEVDLAAEYFGLSDKERELVTTAAPTRKAQRVCWGEAAPTKELANVARFLDRSGLTYGELTELLQVEFVFGVDPGQIMETGCSAEERLIVGINLAEDDPSKPMSYGRLDRAHRFLRLWRRTGWTMWELDRLLCALPAGPGSGPRSLDGATLVQLAGFHRLAQRTGLAVEALLPFYTDLDTGRPGRDDQGLYQRLFLDRGRVGGSAAAFAVASVTGAVDPPAIAGEHRPVIMAALAVTESDLQILLQRTGDALSLTTLSGLYRHVTLARLAGVPIKDLPLLLDGMEIDPFAGPAQTGALLDALADLREAGIGVLELDYLLHARRGSPLGLREEVVRDWLARLAADMAAPEPGADLRSSRAGLVIKLVAVLLRVEDSQARLLLSRLRPPGSSLTLLETMCESPPGPLAVDDPAFAGAFATFERLHKCALLVRLLRLSPAELGWLADGAGLREVLAPGDLPAAPGDPPAPFERLRNLVRLLRFARACPEPGGFLGLLDGLSSATDQDVAGALDRLCALTGWDRAATSALHERLALRFPDDYRLPATYERVAACAALSRLLGVEVARLADWAAREPDAEMAAQIEQAVRARHGAAQWPEVAARLQDLLRERKRAALVHYLLAHPDRKRGRGWRDENDLFAYFLIDVEMSPCQLTSRIVQANGTVQMFVQRCLMNLEPDVVANEELDDGWLQWRWMKRYREWEANRKVFLYPENWLWPERRPDKSPFFQELEDELAQQEITHDAAEAAIAGYLEKLREVAHLEVCGICHERQGSVPIVHVIGRTRGAPPVYYHRRNEGGRWSAWRKIDVDIKGEQILPLIHDRRLHLFWPELTERGEEEQAVPPAQAGTTPPPAARRFWEIKLAWSSLRAGAWTPRRVSERKLIHPWFRPAYSLHFRAHERPAARDVIVDLFVGSSPEYNDRQVVDPRLGRVYRTLRRHSETDPPWHSSQFVFDGDVTEVRLRDLQGSLFEEVQKNYGLDGRSTAPLWGPLDDLIPLPGMHHQHGALVNNGGHAGGDRRLLVLEPRSSGLAEVPLLHEANLPYAVVVPHQDPQVTAGSPFFLQDAFRAYFVEPVREGSRTAYQFHPFYHPYAKLFARELASKGLDGLFRRDLQVRPDSLYRGRGFDFARYRPADNVRAAVNPETIDFSSEGGYSLYNWELFFHVPLLLATRLSQNQRFAEAMRWFHYIFNPTDTTKEEEPQRFWVTKPLFNMTREALAGQQVEKLLKEIYASAPAYANQVRAWRENPFEPHLIAGMRWGAYQRAVVMKYLDNLVAWGDQLFRDGSREALDEATQIYVLAAQLLGPRPRKVPPRRRTAMSYDELERELDDFGNLVVTDVENALPPIDVTGPITPETSATSALPRIESFYFCIPPNEKLLAYWDVVSDRLFKVRHCLNLEGARQALPLLAPPIEPGLLVKARAAGVDLDSVLQERAAPLPPYRFQVVAQKAQELCSEVKGLGAALLAALEKRDVEALALLRVTHETSVLDAVRAVRERQIDEARAQIAALERSREAAQARAQFYGTREFMNQEEKTAQGLSTAAGDFQNRAYSGHLIAAIIRALPNFDIGVSGFGGSPVATVHFGGAQLAAMAELNAMGFAHLATQFDRLSSLAGTQGAYRRRADDWGLQARLAVKEMEQIDRQIVAARIRLAIADNELRNHELQIRNARAVEAHLAGKVTNRELYDWHVSQLATVYFQSYQLAYDVARRAERCFQHELALSESSFVRFGHWDSLKKGLLAGEKLSLDLRRLETAFLERNRRLLEITKHISLALVDPLALLTLKRTGECIVDLPEALFDMDYPGHYLRRLKSASLTIPCVTGPYVSVNCTLTQEWNTTRVSDSADSEYPRIPGGDSRFVDGWASAQSIVTSSAQEDSGLFEPGLRDDRYLPFEGSGVVSRWRISLPQDANAFVFDTISDVILHLRYTARDGGDGLRARARAAVLAALPRRGVRLFSAKHDFSAAWHRFLHPDGRGAELVLDLTPERFPFHRGTIAISEVTLAAASRKGVAFVAELSPAPGEVVSLALAPGPAFAGLSHATHLAAAPGLPPATWRVKLHASAAPEAAPPPADQLEDLLILLRYEVT